MNGSFLTRTVRFGGEDHRYSVFVPEGTGAHPAILYLHGLGRGGRDGIAPTGGGLGRVIRNSDEPFPFLVAFPQSPDDTEFVGSVAALCHDVFSSACAEFRADPERHYLVGGSMGGHGAYHLAATAPNRWAGLVVTCASPRLPEWRRKQLGRERLALEGFDELAAVLRDLPTWIFHGALDETVPVAEARDMVQALRRVGAPVRYTEYPEVGHDRCSLPFEQFELWKWLMEQSRSRGSAL